MPSERDLAAAALLGGTIGMRSLTGPAALALRGRLVHGPLRTGAVAAAAGELLADKAPVAPPRTSVPSLVFRGLSGAVAGRELAGAAGAGVGTAAAIAGTFGSYHARKAITDMTGLPNAVVGLAEDGVAVSAAALATRTGGDEPESDAKALRIARGVVRGAAAGVFGTAVMTGAQLALQKATGSSESRAPETVGRKVIGAVAGKRVKRKHRGTLNQAMHWGYGTQWGIDLGVTGALAGTRPPVLAGGAGLGLAAWTASLIQLPAFDAAPPPWHQPPGQLATDAGLHVLFGLAVAAALRALP
jgi:uncharacterized membrane protein